MTSPDEPRLAPVPFADWDDETRSTLLQFLRRPERYLSGAPDAPPMPIVLEMFAHHLPLSASWLPFTEMLAGEDARLARRSGSSSSSGWPGARSRGTSGPSTPAWVATPA